MKANFCMQPDDEKTRLTYDWMLKAKEDLLAIEKLLAPSRLDDVAAYHAQQAVEKALKDT